MESVCTWMIERRCASCEYSRLAKNGPGPERNGAVHQPIEPRGPTPNCGSIAFCAAIAPLNRDLVAKSPCCPSLLPLPAYAPRHRTRQKASQLAQPCSRHALPACLLRGGRCKAPQMLSSALRYMLICGHLCSLRADGRPSRPTRCARPRPPAPPRSTPPPLRHPSAPCGDQFSDSREAHRSTSNGAQGKKA